MSGNSGRITWGQTQWNDDDDDGASGDADAPPSGPLRASAPTPTPRPQPPVRPAAQPPRRPAPPRILPPTPILDRMGRDLTAQARRGDFDDLVVREGIVRDVARALLRRTKANPVLVGEAGVGKTALVEVLARELLRDPDHERLADVRLVELPVATIVAGSSLRGSLEERLLAVIAELKRRPDIVLFIDEIHLLGGAGAEQAVADILKPALARGDLRVVGATTPGEYDQAIRPDPALARRVLPVAVPEPTAAETRDLLRHLAPRLAAHHGVTIDPEAEQAAVDLSVAYLRDRRLPDKAIDLLDDACTRALLPDPAADADGDGGTDSASAPRSVTARTVAATVAGRTGIPLRHLTGERQAGAGVTGADVEAMLKEAVVGQDAAVAAVAATARLARLGLRDEERPRGVFLFGGPTGVGKTALARALARAVTGSEAALLRIDLSEYQEPHTVARLIGSPPGYVGHDEGGQLTRWLQRQPASVVLLDEFEKAHPRVLDLFLQVFDAGRLTDGQGQTVDARHAWFVLTTNLPIEEDLAILRAELRPEFLNRIDHVLAFEELGLPQLLAIAEREIGRLRTRLGGRVASLAVEPLATLALCRDEEDGRPANGRTVLRNVESDLTHPLALALDAHTGEPPAVRVAASGGGLRVELGDSLPSEPASAPDDGPGR